MAVMLALDFEPRQRAAAPPVAKHKRPDDKVDERQGEVVAHKGGDQHEGAEQEQVDKEHWVDTKVFRLFRNKGEKA
jgi:hypothetical protein